MSSVRRLLSKSVAASRATIAAPRFYTSFRHYSSAVHENDPKTLDEEKARNLSKKQHATSTPHENAPGWNEYLASASEAHIKADKSDATTIESMTTTTIKHVHARHHGDDKVISVEAEYEKEEVDGPLGGAASRSSSDNGNNETKYESRDSEHDSVQGPLKGAKGKPQPSGQAKDLKHHEREHVKKDSTGSEEAVRADRGDI
ncbi:hypothetical protein BD410DRAFT_795202 [Rickenella mellea]|uniref:Uncharacterized protein n=1 Tax=Rickenella mellea TaxID=50990 RepID=A0A4Y7PMB2_9AGAM|nr:hypothetical protein BD410DRAFT_795202 [Rickenella mellea]